MAPPGSADLPDAGVQAAPIRPGEEREFFGLYARHPGVGLRYRGSREALEEAAQNGLAAPQAYLLARRGRAVAGALALARQGGRRALCFFPILPDGAADAPAILGALGAAARAVAAAWNARHLECEVRIGRSTVTREPGLRGLGLAPISDRSLMELRSLRQHASGGTGLRAAEPEEIAVILPAIYASSADPAVRTADARDDLDLMASEHPDLLTRILEHDGEPAGLCIAAIAHGEGTILFTGLTPAVQGRGLGGGLLDASLAMLHAAGARRARLAVADANERAIRVYRSRGFRTVGRLRLYRGAV